MADETSDIDNPAMADRPVHGGIKPADLRALGLKPEDVLDFSASISPSGPPAGVAEAIRSVDLSAYPDPHCLVLREAIASQLSGIHPGQVSVESILVGNGSTEILHLLARAYLSPSGEGSSKSALQLTPTYGEYAGACRLAGAEIACFDGRHRPGFRWDLKEAAACIAQQAPTLVFVCNPNNPTGVFLEAGEVELLAEATIAVGGLLVIDEAYISFVENPWDSLNLLDLGRVVLVRSMTKDYALTGLRLGYSLASKEVTQRLEAFQPDWSVNSLAQAAGLVALEDKDYLVRGRQAVAESKEYLTNELNGLGFDVPPSAANFILVQVGDAASWRDVLMRQGLFVRDCTSFGLPQYIRVGLRTLSDCRRLVEAMAALS